MTTKGVLSGKVAVITGGTSGIGAAASRLFRDAGAHVVALGLEDDAAAFADGERGITTLACDVTEIGTIDHAMRTIGAVHGRIDILFANAGIPGRHMQVEEVDEAGFDRVIAVNLKGVFFSVQRALPFMAEGGTIVLTASMAAHEAMVTNMPYGASKAGVRSLGRSIAAALQPRGIRVNVLTPGLTATPMQAKMGPGGDAAIAAILSRIPMGRMGTADEMAAAALFLASPAASFMTGAEIKVGGGQTDA